MNMQWIIEDGMKTWEPDDILQIRVQSQDLVIDLNTLLQEVT